MLVVEERDVSECLVLRRKCVGVYMWLTETLSTEAPSFLLVFYSRTTFDGTLIFIVNPLLTSTEWA